MGLPPGLRLRYRGAMLVDEDACARCGRLTPTDDLRVWTTRERLREFRRPPAAGADRVRVMAATAGDCSPLASAEPSQPEARTPAIRYRWITSAHALCTDCHALVEADGSRFHDHDRRRAWVVVIAVIGLFAVAWAGFAPFADNWIAAFWRNGAGGR